MLASAGGMAGGSISADPLINFLTGRTAMLKEVKREEGVYLRQLTPCLTGVIS
jgi:hypothetical protein